MPPTAPTQPTSQSATAAAIAAYNTSNPGSAPANFTPPPGSPTVPTNTSTNAKPITAFSSDTANQYIADNKQKITQAANTGAFMDPSGATRYSNGTYAQAPSNAVQTTDASGNTYWSADGKMYLSGPDNGMVDPASAKIDDLFKSLQERFDSTSLAGMDMIKQQYDGLVNEQRDINMRSEASLNQSLLMGGSSRYAQQSSTGQTQSMMTYGLQQISNLYLKEQQSLQAANEAMLSGDMKFADQKMQQYQKAQDTRQKAAQDLADKLQKQYDQTQADNRQSEKDQAIGSIMSAGTTDPTAIIKALEAQGITASAKDVADTISNLNPDAKEIHSMMLTAAQNGAPQAVLANIGKSTNLGDAISAASQYVTDPTSTAGQYQAALRAGYKGTPGDFVAAQKYKEAYASASASESAKARFANSDSNQSKLFQQGVSTLKSELSNRSGGLGLQDQNVNTAIHLKNLFDQYKTTKVVQDTGSAGQGLGTTHTETVYNIPRSAYVELAMGVAKLVSGTGAVAEGTVNNILQATAKGDLNNALTYATGSPQTGSTQEVLRNLRDSVDRQGATSENLRQTYVDDLIGRLPPDLKPEYVDQLTKSAQLNSYTNPSPANMTPAQIDEQAYSKIQEWATDPKNAALLSDLAKEFPTLSNVELAQKLQLMP